MCPPPLPSPENNAPGGWIVWVLGLAIVAAVVTWR